VGVGPLREEFDADPVVLGVKGDGFGWAGPVSRYNCA